MSDNWVVQNLENALNTWNEKLSEIWQLITQSPEQFKGGTIWNVILVFRFRPCPQKQRCGTRHSQKPYRPQRSPV